MNPSFDNQLDLLPQIKATISTWENTSLKNRVLPPEIINPLRESRNCKCPIFCEKEFLDLAMFLGCQAIKNGPNWSDRLLSCMCTIDPFDRTGFCKRKFKEGEDKCKVLNHFSAIKGSSIQPLLLEVEPKEKPTIDEFANQAPSEKYYKNDLINWIKGEFLVQEKIVAPKPPLRLKNALYILAGNGISALDNNDLCKKKNCAHDCVTCIDGVIRGIWGNRVDFFDRDLNNNGTMSTNYLVPRMIYSIYTTMGSTPTTRLSSLANTIAPENYQPKLGL